MDKIQELNDFITEYGYLAIFLFVFLQELGVPNPITNELVLLFSGYMAYTGTLDITKVILISVLADFTGTVILYSIFYTLSKHSVIKHPPKWLSRLAAKLNNLKQRMNNGNHGAIFLGRLTPFIRGYVSVAAGVLQIKPAKFLHIVLLSAIIWSGGLALTGKILGPYWNQLAQKVGMFQFAGLLILLVIGLFFAGKYVTRKELAKQSKRV